MSVDPDLLVLNGLNGSTGNYLFDPLSSEQISRVARGETLDEDHQDELALWNQLQKQKAGDRGVMAGIDPDNLAETGWGVLFAHDADPRIRESLSELLEHRREQANKQGPFYREFSGDEAYRPGESKREFLQRFGAGPGPADPAKIPYYLLIVADPESISFRFQYQLDVQYAVGRLWFDGPNRYERFASYARSVVLSESGSVKLPRKAAFFGVCNPGDRATELSRRSLVKPLAEQLPRAIGGANRGGNESTWEIETWLAADATKANLSRLVGGDKTPALLFTASHGMGFDLGDVRQLAHQGALLCQDWPGRSWKGPIPEDHYFSGDDITSDACLTGSIAFHFACYGGGTPRLDEFSHLIQGSPRSIAPHNFVARLPQSLLGHPNGGALAAIGHVERAWGYSFMDNKAGPQLQCFQSTLLDLMSGHRVGACMEYFNSRYAELSCDLSLTLEDVRMGEAVSDFRIAGLWTENNDARTYIVLGDPAVKLPVADGSDDSHRPRLSSTRATADQAAAPKTGQPDSKTPETGRPMKNENQLLGQVSETEKRFAERQAAKSVSFDLPSSSGSRFIIQNDTDRLQKRLTELGMSYEAIEQALGGGQSFRTFSNDDEPPSSADVLLERILGRNEMVDAHFLEAGFRCATTVGRIRILSNTGQKRGFGTGSLIGPRLLLTNNHVLQDATGAESSLIEFGVEDRPGVATTPAVAFRFQPDIFFLTDQHLDFTLVALQETSQTGIPLQHYGWNTPHLDDDPILNGEYVNIIQHPGGRPKQVALRDNEVTDILENFLHYRSDTEPGSSGAPVFNDQWQLVGLHHSGVPRRDDQDRILARDGSVWESWMGAPFIDWIANEGVRISRIMKLIADADLPDSAKPLRDDLFELRQPTSVSPIHQPGPPSIETGTVAGSTATFDFNIPLSISVSIGNDQQITVVTSADVEPDTVVAADRTTTQQSKSPKRRAQTTAADGKAVGVDPAYANRTGYDPDFLGEQRVPLPQLPETARPAAAVVQGNPADNPFELKYHHYSVVMNAVRRLAFFTAVNIHGKQIQKVKRGHDKWLYDPRIAESEQVGNQLYDDNLFDRGHLVRRLDPTWGNSLDIARAANDDTFHWTNCGPQHERFNRGKKIWQGLENFLLERADDADQKLTVFTGPVFRDSDPLYRDIAIPTEFWKVALLIRNGQLASIAFVVSQAGLLGTALEEGAIDVAETFQVPVEHVEELTGLDFGHAREVQVTDIVSFDVATDSRRRPIGDWSDITL